MKNKKLYACLAAVTGVAMYLFCATVQDGRGAMYLADKFARRNEKDEKNKEKILEM